MVFLLGFCAAPQLRGPICDREERAVMLVLRALRGAKQPQVRQYIGFKLERA